MQRDKLPGAAVGLVRDGMVQVAAAGWADLAAGRPMDGNETLLQAASISKVLTGWAVLELADQGRIDLDAPVQRFLSRWRLPVTTQADGVTVRRILSHTSGLSCARLSGFHTDGGVTDIGGFPFRRGIDRGADHCSGTWERLSLFGGWNSACFSFSSKKSPAPVSRNICTGRCLRLWLWIRAASLGGPASRRLSRSRSRCQAKLSPSFAMRRKPPLDFIRPQQISDVSLPAGCATAVDLSGWLNPSSRPGASRRALAPLRSCMRGEHPL